MPKLPENTGTILDDLRKGVRYALARRAKLVVYVVAAASFLVVNGYVSGDAEAICNVIIALAGAGLLHQVPNAEEHRAIQPGAEPDDTDSEEDDRPLPYPHDDGVMRAEVSEPLDHVED